jgi:hypothetical protein
MTSQLIDNNESVIGVLNEYPNMCVLFLWSGLISHLRSYENESVSLVLCSDFLPTNDERNVKSVRSSFVVNRNCKLSDAQMHSICINQKYLLL